MTGTTETIIAFTVLLTIIVLQQVFIWMERKTFDKMIKDLHTRLMARSLPEYAAADKLIRTKPDEAMTSKEREEGMRIALEESGIYDVGT